MFYHIYWLQWRQLSLKKSLLVKCKSLRLFVNTFIAYDKYSVLNREYSTQVIHMQLSIKTKDIFSIFFCSFKRYIKFWTFSKKRWSSEIMYFRYYGLRNAWSDKCLKSAIPHYRSTSNIVNALKHCSNLNDGSFIIFFWLLSRQLSLKKSLLVIWKILGLFLHTFTARDKYSFLNMEYLAQPAHMQFSQILKKVSEFLSAFLKCRLIIEHILKKDDTHS